MWKRIVALLVLAFFVCGANNDGCFGAEERAKEKCENECPLYGATYVRVTRAGGDGSDEASYECWCRKGAESGSGSEPMRIW